ncbi:MAG: hypothetical protein COW01_03000 [Bdellovibrionales bacterium CG12_big_fil_rev_8_21_14_0_65_38_15]|nr:MAG: hypothetical protein COW79_12240 [Bdellovibrionales bacterium CG22_combo_CG10-13_8_21_14_all_38_13]PIQ56815.1 MAG: hypothetical protein COW01_03000 [Bdellovibrionales bacterium CG12_big_fil_rev_8_21_14_0_65_38_15]PIR28542.1 MAG: hypothetical protein COV38_15305 [Bdellovibrionales bacterium CG11_big_fil_rev_8_21_14_0_20_38_13]
MDNFRQSYQRDEIGRFYNPMVHIFLNFGFLIVGQIICLNLMIQFKFYFIFIFFLVFVLGDFVVWFIHKFPLHQPNFPGGSYAFKKHAVLHHGYFNKRMTYDSLKELHAIFFPVEVVIVFSLVLVPIIIFLLSLAIPTDLAFFIGASFYFYFMTYEFIHWLSHQQADYVLFRFNHFKRMQSFHTIHHDNKFMTNYNFGIVSNIFDKLLKTELK